MKKIVINTVIVLENSAITLEQVKTALAQFGQNHFTCCSEINTRSSVGLTKEIWIYISSNEEDPYLIVSDSGKLEGSKISSDDMNNIMEHGVCIAFFAEYPRANKYGAPNFSTDENVAASIASDHGFSVDLNVFSSNTADRGDDGGEEIWLQIALPENE